METSEVKDWIDSPYYSLWNGEDKQSKLAFIDNLLSKLNPVKGAKILEVGCRTGDFSKYISTKGFDVTGLDFSFKGVHKAKQLESDNLHFFQQDIRLLFWINYFDYAFNLFTNFGNYNTIREHDNAIRSISQSLKTDGYLIMDYLNVHYEEDNLKKEQIRQIDEIEFIIDSTEEEETFTKNISIRDKGEEKLSFSEKNWKLSIGDFTDLFAYRGLQIEEVFGDYNLGTYDMHKSPRLVMVAKKIRR